MKRERKPSVRCRGVEKVFRGSRSQPGRQEIALGWAGPPLIQTPGLVWLGWAAKRYLVSWMAGCIGIRGSAARGPRNLLTNCCSPLRNRNSTLGEHKACLPVGLCPPVLDDLNEVVGAAQRWCHSRAWILLVLLHFFTVIFHIPNRWLRPQR
jgi:hypothetical protein